MSAFVDRSSSRELPAAALQPASGANTCAVVNVSQRVWILQHYIVVVEFGSKTPFLSRPPASRDHNALDELITYIESKPGLWFATLEKTASYVKQANAK